MIDALFAVLNATACLLCSWVAGCYLLSLGRPARVEDLVLAIGALGVCMYGIGNAFAPIRWQSLPTAFELGARVSLALAAAVFYSRQFGWRALLAGVLARPRTLVRWVLSHVADGRRSPKNERARR